MSLCGKTRIVHLIFMGILFWLGHQTLISEPDPASADGLWNLYKPAFYLIPFLMGYFVFSHNTVQGKIAKAWPGLMASGIHIRNSHHGSIYTFSSAVRNT
jgi:hypothetical protein